jgi:hypothetical protein
MPTLSEIATASGSSRARENCRGAGHAWGPGLDPGRGPTEREKGSRADYLPRTVRDLRLDCGLNLRSRSCALPGFSFKVASTIRLHSSLVRPAVMAEGMPHSGVCKIGGGVIGQVPAVSKKRAGHASSSHASQPHSAPTSPASAAFTCHRSCPLPIRSRCRPTTPSSRRCTRLRDKVSRVDDLPAGGGACSRDVRWSRPDRLPAQSACSISVPMW